MLFYKVLMQYNTIKYV